MSKDKYKMNKKFTCFKCSFPVGINFNKAVIHLLDGRFSNLECPFCGHKDNEYCFKCKGKGAACTGCTFKNY
jgi:hypothetical protein